MNDRHFDNRWMFREGQVSVVATPSIAAWICRMTSQLRRAGL